MAATPKHRRSTRRRDNTRSQPGHKARKPALQKLASGSSVPRHMVTKQNPSKKGVKFLKTDK